MPTERPTRVLIIDDSSSDAALIAAKLRNATFGTFEIETIAAFPIAVSRLRERHFDLALLDLRMPGVEGLDGLKQLIEDNPEVPIIVLTGVTDDSVGIDSIRAGAQDYLVKQLYHHHAVIRRILYAIERHKIRLADRADS